MNNNYRLQLRHGDEAKNFVTRYDVFKHINGQLQYGGVSLLPYEPVLFYYGEEDNKNAIIMVGLPEGDTHKGKSYFIIDTADLKEQIKAIDEKYDAAIKALQEEDGKLWEAINKEIEDRIAAVEAEAQARSEKDADLEKSIAEETEARIAADEAEAQARSEKDAELEEAIADEAEARTKADEALQAAIDYTKADLMSVVEACGLIYNDKLAEDRVSYEPDTHDEIIRDSKDIADAVDKISKFAAKMAKDLKISVANTDTVNLTMTPNEKDGGNTITADVNIAGAEGLSKKTFDNNIIGKTTDGIYASVAIEPSEKNPNKLIVKTSGYVDGKFKVDAFETEVDLTAYIGDNGKDTGITVSVDPDKNTIKAQLNLSSDKNNILKLEDGEYVVEGVAKNIKYGDSNVAAALKGHASKIETIEEEIEFVKGIEVKGSESSTSTVTVDKSVKGDFFVNNDVKLSKDHSIIIANGGLQANVSANFNEATSNLTITVGDNNYIANLSGLAVSVLESATYDSVTEEIVLTFRVGDSFKTLRIPVGTLIHDIEVEDTDSIDLTLTSVSGGPERLSAELKVDKAHADNLLTVNSNGAYVSRAFITEAVKEESDARKEADKELKSKIDDVTKLANDNKEAIAEEIHTARAAEKANADAIAQEIKDARAAEKANADAIANNSKAIAENTKAIADETSRATKAEEANADAIVAEENRAKAAEVKNENAIASEIDRATEKEADLLDKIGNNDVKIKENKDAIAAEVERATKAEKVLSDSVSKNASDIANETLRAKTAEEANKTAIETEVVRAKTAEGELAADVAKNATAANEAKALAEKNKTDLATEVTRATAAEKANADAIASEASRATTAEETINAKVTKNTTDIESAKNDITAESTRATAAEAELTTKLTGEVTRAKAAESANATAIETEKNRAIVAEEANKSAIEAEASRATAAENALNAKAEKNASDIDLAKTAIGTELTRATAAEAELTTKLTDEVTRAKAAENANATAIVNETARATEKENEIYGKVNDNTAGIAQNAAAIQSLNVEMTSEVARAKAAEETNKTAIETEKGRAEHAEADLLEKINANTDAIQTITTEVGNIELVKEGDLSYALYVNGTKHGEFTIPKDQFLKSVNYNASTKELVFVFNTSAGETTTTVSIADLIDTYVAGEGLLLNGNVFSVDFTSVASVDAMQAAVNAEVARAKAAEETNKTAIEAEASRAAEKEADLLEKINANSSNIAKNTTDIATEVARAKDAEGVIVGDLASEVSRAKTAEGVITNELANEITRAKAAETANATAIEAEASRANTAEGVILEKIVEESNRAKSVETTLESNVAKAASDIITESTRATAAEAELTNKLSNEVIRAKAAEETNKTAIETEKGRAEHAEADLLEKIGSEHNLIESVSSAVDNATKKAEDDLKSVKAELTSEINKKANSADVYTKEETLNKLGDYAKTVDVQSKLDEKANVVDVKNVYATKEALQELKDGYASTEYVDNEDNKLAERISGNETAIDNFNLTYDAATSTLVYTDKNGQTNEYKLYSGSLIKNGRFDEDSNSIILTIENAGQESQIVIPVSKLLTDLSKKIEVNSEDIKKINEALTKVAKDWTVKNSNTIDLVKSTVGEKDELTASVRVATSNKNAIQTGESGLYVSNDLEDFTCVFGTETISGQSAISTLYEGAERMSDRITTNERNIELLSSEVTKNTTDISNLKDEVNDTKTEMASIKSQVAANTTAITRIDNEIDRVESRLDNVTDRLETAEGNITSMIHRLAVMEEDVANIKKDLKAHSDKFVEVEAALANLGNGFDAILAELDKVKLVTGYPTYVNTKNMSVRLDNIDEQMKKIVDAGTF